MNRRHFLQSSAAWAGTMVLPFSLQAGQEKVSLAILGTGWWGTDMLLPRVLASGLFEVVALCDVNSLALARAAKAVTDAGAPAPRLFADYREMYRMPGLKAVIIATPTHWHALQFMDACKAGLHVFLEKPICYDIREGQAMLAAHQAAGNVVQVDFPRVMADTNDQVRAFIQSGEAGKIRQVQANIHSPEGGLTEKPVPATLDYDRYCGPAPLVPYRCDANGTTPQWRQQHAFGRGIMADWGIHYLHNIRRVLGLDLPEQVSALGGIVSNTTQDQPDHLDVRFSYGGLPVYWSHKSWGYTAPDPDHNIGVYYYGEKATIFAGDLGWEVFPAGGKAKITHGSIVFNPMNPANTPVYEKMLLDMLAEFAEGIRTRSNAGITNTLADAYRTTAAVIYADMAYRTQAGLAIDAATMNVKGNPQAQAMLQRAYRVPYVHPFAP
ncbi:MAG: Gfo/Idh/MocA family oxidoreductase [Bacteroidia bacterium]|nr:Gfo/Idh/MocA family oxidoreductase [Bacteroidia bacterium]